MINLIKKQHDHVIDKIYLYARDLNEPKYQFLIKKCENAGIKHYNNPNAFIECSHSMDDIRLNTTHYFIMKINNGIELKYIATDHSADIDYQDFKKVYRECTKEPYNFLTIDTTLLASDPLRFRKNLFDSYKNDNNRLD